MAISLYRLCLHLFQICCPLLTLKTAWSQNDQAVTINRKAVLPAYLSRGFFISPVSDQLQVVQLLVFFSQKSPSLSPSLLLPKLLSTHSRISQSGILVVPNRNISFPKTENRPNFDFPGWSGYLSGKIFTGFFAQNPKPLSYEYFPSRRLKNDWHGLGQQRFTRRHYFTPPAFICRYQQRHPQSRPDRLRWPGLRRGRPGAESRSQCGAARRWRYFQR